MEEHQSTYLLDLPDEILEKIVNYLPFFAIRKNLRLTCTQLNNLCNVDRFHRDEVIVWSAKSQFKIAKCFQKSCRESFNLIFSDVTLNAQHVSKFFEQHGAKVQSLSFMNCKSPPGLLESIIERCEALCNLSIKGFTPCSFSFGSKEVTRPTVASLELVLDLTILQQSPTIFPRIRSVFPCVKHLSIELVEITKRRYRVKDSVIFDFVVSFSNLKSLELNVKLPTLFFNKPKFLDLLPQLEKLSLSLASSPAECTTFWKTIASQSKASSIEIRDSTNEYPRSIELLLSMTSLKHLSYSGTKVSLPMDTFRALVSSQLETISFHVMLFELSGDTNNLPSKANETVTDLIIQRKTTDFSYFSVIMSPFAVSFCGLVHLEMKIVTDDFLEQIFKHQKNLRSLVLLDCQDCTASGFCGENDEEDFANSTNNLQNLEHLQIDQVNEGVFQTKIFQEWFKFPRLKYLKIVVTPSDTKIEIPVDLFRNCVNLEALHLRNFSTPSSTLLSSLFECAERLNYLHFFSIEPEWTGPTSIKFREYQRTYVKLKNFPSVDSAKLLSDCDAKAYHHDHDLDRTVFIKKLGRKVTLTSPKFSFHTVDWINID